VFLPEVTVAGVAGLVVVGEDLERGAAAGAAVAATDAEPGVDVGM
jgi:hypothetical protein